MAYTQQWSTDAEEQYYLEYARAIQEQERYLSQDGYNRYSLGYSQFEDIPEDAELAFSTGDVGNWVVGTAGPGERLADRAVLSWRVEKVTGSQIGDLGQSMRAGSEVEIKELVKQRGGHKLEGIHKAAAQGDRTGIMHYMKQYGPGAPINDLDPNGCTPLMYAALADSVLAIEMLLNFSARREKTDAEGRTAVHYAAFFGKPKALKFLIDAAADWTPRDVYGRTPLHWSAANKSTRCLSILLNHASIVMGDINPRDNEGMTPVHCAAQLGRPKHILLLNEADADIAAVDIEGKTALHWTVSNPDTSSALALVEAYPPLTSKRDLNSNSVLHLAASIGSTHIVDALLKLNGVEIDALNEQGRTALHLVCMNNHPDTAKLLLINGASDAPVDVDGLTALHYAVETKSPSTVTAFDQLVEITHVPNSEGRTPLMMAANYGLEEILSTLIKNRGVAKSVDSVDPNGHSALHLAAHNGSSECVSSLLSCGANPNIQDQLQQTPLFLTVVQGHAQCVQLLVSGGCQPDTRDSEEHAPVHLAVIHRQVECIQSLARSGADLNILDSNRDTALHMAAYSGDDQSTTTLLEYGANPNIQNTSGWTPVHYAAMEGQLECLATLITHRAYTNFRDFSDERCTPMDLAVLNGHIDCMDVLTQGGALTTTEIRSFAAVSIQTAYRAYRARCELSVLRERSRAVTVIASQVRGYLQRVRFREMLRRQHAAIRLQSHVRGFLQRVKFAVQLSHHRAQEHHYQLMVDYGQRVTSDRENNLLKTFKRKDFIPSEDLTALDLYNIKEQREREKKTRLEKALQMREIFLEKQKNWKAFLEAEQKRRDDKAKKEELNRYSEIVAESRARKEYNELMFQQTHTVRSHTTAALVLQKAYRKMKLRRLLTERVSQRLTKKQKRREERAARTIQRAWREYQQYRLYQHVYFKKVQTSPVITLTGHTLPKVASYQKGISITGNPRRRVHQTEESGFKLFRPTTRDLLFKPQSNTLSFSPRPPSDYPPSTNNQSLSYMLSGKHAITTKMNVSPRQQLSRRKFIGKMKRGQILPELVIKDKVSTHTHMNNKKTKLHLPNIVEI